MREFKNMKNYSCDIFCKVVDNYGDIGVCWRLARQLANEFGLSVRLWVDDLKSLSMLCPEADTVLDIQSCRGVEVRLWNEEFPDVQPAGLVIETFSCMLPQPYLAQMDASHVWINLEYLSAESWVEGCHKLPSPRPPLIRHFFFPGFTEKTGGLILEKGLFARRDAFLKEGVENFWRSKNIAAPSDDTLTVSLFPYENSALEDLFDVWARSSKRILCLVPEGRILPQVKAYFSGGLEVRGNLEIAVLPFVEQEKYDELLWACDINFVRGEDSFVRAQWAGKPLIWQIYHQHDGVHRDKLEAFLELYCRKLPAHAASAMRDLWRAWNGSGDSMVYAWSEFLSAHAEIDRRAMAWAEELSKNNLALNLLDYFQEIGTMRAFK